MRREVHVRFCERLAVTFRGPTLPRFFDPLFTMESIGQRQAATWAIRESEFSALIEPKLDLLLCAESAPKFGYLQSVASPAFRCAHQILRPVNVK
jgi:hypothetical protein